MSPLTPLCRHPQTFHAPSPRLPPASRSRLSDLGSIFAYLPCTRSSRGQEAVPLSDAASCRALQCGRLGRTLSEPRCPEAGRGVLENLMRCCVSSFGRYCLRLWGKIKVTPGVGLSNSGFRGLRCIQRSDVVLRRFLFYPIFSQIADATILPEPWPTAATGVCLGYTPTSLYVLPGIGFGALSS
jgi:hypothetical protein